MHGFTGRADVSNSAAVFCIVETHRVYSLCFHPSSPVMLADNKAFAAALVPVLPVMYCAHAQQQGWLNCSPRGV